MALTTGAKVGIAFAVLIVVLAIIFGVLGGLGVFNPPKAPAPAPAQPVAPGPASNFSLAQMQPRMQTISRPPTVVTPSPPKPAAPVSSQPQAKPQAPMQAPMQSSSSSPSTLAQTQPMSDGGVSVLKHRYDLATGAQDRSRAYAAKVHGTPSFTGSDFPAPKTSTLQTGPGANPNAAAVEAQYQRALAATGASALGTTAGQLPQVIHSGPENSRHLVHLSQTSIGNTHTGNLQDAFHDSTDQLALLAPDDAMKLNKALSLSGTPSSFLADDDTESKRKTAAIVHAMLMTSRVEPKLEDVMATTSPFIATKALIQRSLAAQASVDRPIVRAPMRWLYSAPAWRQSVPVPTMSPILPDGITPGQEFYMEQIQCGNSDPLEIMVQEPLI